MLSTAARGIRVAKIQVCMAHSNEAELELLNPIIIIINYIIIINAESMVILCVSFSQVPISGFYKIVASKNNYMLLSFHNNVLPFPLYNLCVNWLNQGKSHEWQ